ncbi:hypothetical protein GDO81_006924 [Engystomops pustulosus]|uniref:Uncharacterized protein n=1 Tax=Engystomops pustulosus TaxID=76066 RepID=A0AAV7D0C8_ENGPU|nr:hypothetical protein GDO81_006924 [Engystomops pustulosus]
MQAAYIHFMGSPTSTVVQIGAARIGADFVQCFVPGILRRTEKKKNQDPSWTFWKDVSISWKYALIHIGNNSQNFFLPHEIFGGIGHVSVVTAKPKGSKDCTFYSKT